MSVEIAWKQNILVIDSYLLKLMLVVFGFGLHAFICDFSRQNICSVTNVFSIHVLYPSFYFRLLFFRERLALVFLKRATNLYRKPLSNFDVFDSVVCTSHIIGYFLFWKSLPIYTFKISPRVFGSRKKTPCAWIRNAGGM